MPPFAAPRPVAGLAPAHLLPCDERARFRYQNPCSNIWNNARGFAPHSLSPNANAGHFRSRRCAHPNAHIWPNTHHVCRYCIAAAEAERWFKLATTYFVYKPSAGADNNRSRYYLTRLCRLCEAREETLLVQLLNGAPMQLQLPTPAARRYMTEWPRNRCTCERRGLYLGVRCHPHRKMHWDDMRQFFVDQRKHNRKYLINTVRNGLGQRVDSTDLQRQTRRNNGRFRACRCGADPVATIAQATVMQCMSCEGIVHFHTAPGGPQPAFGTLPPNATPFQLSQNSLSTPDLFTISGYWGIHRRTDD